MKKEVGKVGEDSPLFIIPLDSAENKSNIANFFTKSPQKSQSTSPLTSKPNKHPSPQAAVKNKSSESREERFPRETVDENAGGEDLNSESRAPGKRRIMESDEMQREHDFADERVKVSESQKSDERKEHQEEGKGQQGTKTLQRKPTKRARVTPTKKMRNAGKVSGNKITSFFGK